MTASRSFPPGDRHQQTAAEEPFDLAAEANRVAYMYRHASEADLADGIHGSLVNLLEATRAAAEQRVRDEWTQRIEALAAEMERDTWQRWTGYQVAARLRALADHTAEPQP